jgi:hypothetical protein
LGCANAVTSEMIGVLCCCWMPMRS